MQRTWQMREAKARFGELLRKSLAEGPQIVTYRGVETAVVVPIEQWRRMERSKRRNIKDWLLAPEARTETLVPPKGAMGLRLRRT
ncbi:MAG: type II toxin-antitoxin system Phd/YefM family antitoxin [Acidimicrobiia bacterium]|nr:type II toxin-antitoxin system Phd/YefM family antitoxin [Acidimicrobiia bacterium]MYF84096.1 type II toxin-antitoxin system Phd/YefM family antitoxin [Acidimicrobiia bacterium]